MPYSEKLEQRIDAAVSTWQELEKKKMFGGTCYLTAGNMCFGIYKDFLIVRLGGSKTLGKWLRSGREFAETLPPK